MCSPGCRRLDGVVTSGGHVQPRRMFASSRTAFRIFEARPYRARPDLHGLALLTAAKLPSSMLPNLGSGSSTRNGIQQFLNMVDMRAIQGGGGQRGLV
jgi:hypothetical protein